MMRKGGAFFGSVMHYGGLVALRCFICAMYMRIGHEFLLEIRFSCGQGV